MADLISNKRILGATLLYQVGLAYVMAVFLSINKLAINWDVLAGVFDNWDAHHYLYLAESGYQSTGEESSYIAFFPFYPSLIRLLSFVVPNLQISGLILSIAGSIIGHAVFIKYLGEIGFVKDRSWRIALLLFFAPITVYFSIIYTEGLYLAESALFLYLLEKRKYEWAILIGFCATLTRLFGFLLIIPYLAHFIEKKSWHLHLERIIQALVIIPSGLFVYFLINFIVFADPFHFKIVQKQYWQKESVNFIKQYLYYARGLFELSTYKNFNWGDVTFTADRFFTVLAPIILVSYLLICFVVKRKQPMPYGLTIWAIAQLCIITSQTFWLSNARYVCLILPLYIALEEVLWLYPPCYYSVLIGFGILAIIGVHLFSKEAWLY